MTSDARDDRGPRGGNGGNGGGGDRDRGDRGGPRRSGGGGGGGGGGRFRRVRGCEFCRAKTDVVDYKNVNMLRRYITESGKMDARRKVGTCARHQRVVAQAVKRSREIALLPYTSEHIRLSGGMGRR
jgi:small subunit ribosomal protein S18